LIQSEFIGAIPSIDQVLTPNREAKIEFGDTFTSKLKLTKDGTKILWPQPTDDPEDPQNV
jgi:hypothetical protein